LVIGGFEGLLAEGGLRGSASRGRVEAALVEGAAHRVRGA
jgi:hypothetical protein